MRKILTLSAILFPLLAPTSSLAKTLVVDPAGGGDHMTIKEATDAARADTTIDLIFVRRANYSEAVTVKSDVTLQGEETAGTILTGGVTMESGATLERFTIKKTVFLPRLSAAVVRNNIFTGISDTALKITSTDAVDDSTIWVLNNTFYNNTSGKAVEFVSDSIPIVSSKANLYNNIFLGNSTAVSRVTAISGILSNNFFASNTQNLSQGAMDSSNKSGTDPQFADTATDPPDLHLKTDSIARDFGAFGSIGTTTVGSSPDTTPAPPFALTHETTSRGIKLTWKRNLASDSSVATDRVKWSATASNNEDDYVKFAEVPANSGTTQSFTFKPADYGLGTPPATPPAAPTGVTVSPLDRSIRVNWSAVTGAGGYRVKWGTAPDALTSGEADAGNTRSYKVTGLSNGTAYYAAVAAYNVKSVYVVVTALPKTAPSAETEGESRPSDYESVPASQSDPTAYTSAAGSATPDSISGFPALESKVGCFLSTLPATPAAGAGAPLAALVVAAALGLTSLVRRLSRSTLCLGGLVFAAFTLFSAGALAAETPAGIARWAFSVSGGVLRPKQDHWADNYDDKRPWQGKLGVGFRLLPQLEIGVDGGYWKAEGKVSQTDNGQVVDPAVKQTLTVLPLQAYVLVQLYLSENQWVVPYVAGGYSRYYYRHEVDHGSNVTGHQDGYHARGGLKILLDALDPFFAERAFQNIRLRNTYLTLEAQYARVDDRGASSTDLGGLSYLMGVSVEF